MCVACTSLLGAGFLCVSVYLLAHGVTIKMKPPKQNLDLNFFVGKSDYLSSNEYVRRKCLIQA